MAEIPNSSNPKTAILDDDVAQEDLLVMTDLARIGTWKVDTVRQTIHWSRRVRMIHEVDDDFVPDFESAVNFYPGAACDEIRSLVRRAIEEKMPFDVELPFVTQKGRRIYVRSAGTPIEENGRVVRLIGAFADVTESVRTREILRSTQERLTTATMSANLGLWDWNPKTDHAWFNDQWWTMLGYRPGELEPSGKTWLALLSPKDRDRVAQELRDHVDGRSENYRVEFRMLCKDGSWRWILAQGRVVERDASGDAVRLSGIHVDITASKELEFRLAAARDAAEEAARAKSRFLATMSHEIRTPMNGILGTAALLKETRLDDEQTEYVETIRESGDSLLAIINDVLDFSKVESGGMTIEKTRFSLTRTIEEIRRLMASAASAKKIGLRVSIAPDLSPTVVGDGGRLRQILLNLVGNAIKFTSRGDVDLDVENCPLDPTGRTIRFKVRDSGIGIDESALSRLFQPFSQADASTTRRFGGTGLGLAISKRLAELMGGTIEVVSAKGIGSQFTLVCPFDSAPSEEKAATTKSVPIGKPQRDFNVLVADDNPINRRVAVRILERLGCRAETAETGAEAIEKHVVGNFDLILMDWHMPEVDGVEATRRIRRLAERADVPIIAMTANAMPGDREQCLESGMNDCLTKPVKPDEVAAMIDRWVGPTSRDPSSPIGKMPSDRTSI